MRTSIVNTNTESKQQWQNCIVTDDKCDHCLDDPTWQAPLEKLRNFSAAQATQGSFGLLCFEGFRRGYV